ncbi:MAG: hypothetical protein HY063_14620 [Bacteroidetes bacterium]|nr:hypothetical protein [Bacteroidota bacterium]
MKVIALFISLAYVQFVFAESDSAAIKTIHKFKLEGFYFQIGDNNYRNDNGGLGDFKTLSSNSVLLQNNFSNYNSYEYANTIYSGTYLSLSSGIKFRNKDKTAYKKNTELRIGLDCFTTFPLFHELSTPHDTTKNINHNDTSYSMAYFSRNIRLNGSLIYRTNPARHFSFYTGAGITAGISINKTVIDKQIIYDDTSYDSVSEKQEIWRNKNSFGGSFFIPMGVDWRMGNKRNFWKHSHLFYEVRVGANVSSIPELNRTTVSMSWQNLFGARVSLMPVEIYKHRPRSAVKPDTIIKNEIAVGIAPILYRGLQPNPPNNLYQKEERYSLINEVRSTYRIIYKHFFNKSAIRFGFFYENVFRGDNQDFFSISRSISYSYFSFPPSTAFSTASSTDSTSSYLDYTLSGQPSKGLSAGYEYKMGKKKLKFIFGFDVLGAVYPISETTDRVKEKFRNDTLSFPPYVVKLRYSYEYTALEEQKSYLKKISIAPFWGMRYDFTHHFSMSIQTGVESYWLLGKIKFIDDNGTAYSQSVNEFMSMKDSFFTDISLIYRFQKISFRKKISRL